MSQRTKNVDGSVPYTDTRMPTIEARKAFVLPGAFYGAVVGLMTEAGYTKAKDLTDADVVVFTGGSDISPTLYGQKNVFSGGIDERRDSVEVAIYHDAVERGLVLFGICRGAQFLHAMNGGKLWQDVNNHSRTHSIVDVAEDVTVDSTSLHHQMLQVNADIEVVAVAQEQVATRFRDATTDIRIPEDTDSELEIEAGAYPKTKSFFVQGHPEIGSAEYRSWCMTRLNDYYLDWTGKTVQIKDVIGRMN